MINGLRSSNVQRTVLALVRDYDACFAEFLRPSGNGQKILQAILMRAAFQRLAQERVAIRQDGASTILDVSCGPGDFSAAWASDIAKVLPFGMIFYCTDHAAGVSRTTGERYTTATVNKIRAAAQRGNLVLAEAPIGIDADLFFGDDRLMPLGKHADVVHWSHSGYHVRDALGPDKDQSLAIETGMNTAIGKMWSALDCQGLILSIHQTRDISDGVPSQMMPISRSYSGALDDVPELIEQGVARLGGYVASINFATPLFFAKLDEAGWECLKRPAEWPRLGPAGLRNLMLLNFSACDFSDPDRAGLEKLAMAGKLASFVDAFKTVVTPNDGRLLVKCAFQLIAKSQGVAMKLKAIAGQLRQELPVFQRQMAVQMDSEGKPGH
ncbi:hypothetical protein [Bradyrhizobium sp. USDA 10063]